MSEGVLYAIRATALCDVTTGDGPCLHTTRRPETYSSVNDPEPDGAPGVTRGRNMRSRCQCSMCPAIHINSRSWLRSSSTHEPSDPPLRVVTLIKFVSNRNRIDFVINGVKGRSVKASPAARFGTTECHSSVCTDNDPSAGSPTETLLRLLLPLDDTVQSSS